MAFLFTRATGRFVPTISWRSLRQQFVRRYALPRQVRLDQRRIFIVPTRHGFVFGIMVLVMLLGSINYDNNLAFLLTFLLAGMGLVAILHTFRNIVGLSFSVGKVFPAFAGLPAKVQVIVENPEPLSRCNVQFSFSGATPCRVDLLSGSTTVIVELPGQQRGIHRLSTLRIETEFPVGLFRAWSYIDLDGDYLVYPKPWGQPLHHIVTHASGQLSAAVAGGNDDFLGFRRYQPGDSLRHIHWKAVARGREPLTKQFGEHESPQLWLEWDTVLHLGIEDRLSQLCQWILDAENAGLSYGFRMPGVNIGPGRGEIHRLNCLRPLALFGTRK